jgi:hypothetical protein
VSDLREIEIFDRLISSFRAAEEHCRALAQQQHRIKGERYNKLRIELNLIEGACRQASAWREDSRWLQIGQYAAECHKRCGGWLRHRDPPKYFKLLADNMLMMMKATQTLKDQATGVRGAILPATPKYEPANRRVSMGGIIIPTGAMMQ